MIYEGEGIYWDKYSNRYYDQKSDSWFDADIWNAK